MGLLLSEKTHHVGVPSVDSYEKAGVRIAVANNMDVDLATFQSRKLD
jgi:hypothetical protein